MAQDKITRPSHPCPHCLTKFPSPSARDIHARAVHENKLKLREQVDIAVVDVAAN